MDLRKVTDAADGAALESDPEMAGRVLLLFVAPQDGGLWLHRVGRGTHQLGGTSADDFTDAVRAAVEQLWPEAPKKTQRWLVMLADLLVRGPISKMLGVRDD
jgi:hypothetical protein